jgi:ABC-2 type transport system ATP-binding protein
LASHLLDEVEKVCSHVVVLRKGKMLYAGPVSEMGSNHGSLIVASSDMGALKQFLEKHPAVASVETHERKYKALLSHPLSAESLNKDLFNQGIVLSHLIQSQESLEDKFIQLTDNE